MWEPHTKGVYLQRVKTNESNKIIIKLVRAQTEEADNLKWSDRFDKVTVMVLHIKVGGAEEYRLDFDPWSDINVIPDGSIDEKDINAITEVGL
ncbi:MULTISPECIES: hypothetical protein [unclassified Pseudomonas]|uniref:Uncharacterized protein n=1 Tax=Pseudomonas sp. MYb327 TaxID=2745230 RepID=A0AAU8DZK2_9PSED